MLRIRKSSDRGWFDHGWLQTYHTFSFGGYRDPQHVHFRALRVMNEDWVAPGQGFGTHPHDNMEILTYVLSGELEHRDSLGSGGVLRAGEFQRMSAGTGIEHSEFNPSATTPLHLYQIWLFPARQGLAPSYEQKQFPAERWQGRWGLVAAPDAAEGALRIHQDARILLARLDPGEQLACEPAPGRHAWLQVIRGELELAGQPLAAGDGVAASAETNLSFRAQSPAELLWFDLA